MPRNVNLSHKGKAMKCRTVARELLHAEVLMRQTFRTPN